MPEPIQLDDAALDTLLSGDRPVMLLITNGDGLRSDFRVAFNKRAGEDTKTVYARIDPTANPAAAARFGVADKPVLIVWYCGEEIARRSRPWGSDLPLAAEQLEKAVRERNPQAAPQSSEQPSDQPEAERSEQTVSDNNNATVYDKPVNVTDDTFEQEVLNSDLPVLIDFWAAWCGPCRMVAPILEKLASEFAGQIKIAKVDVDNNPGLSQAFRIQSIPNLMVVKDRTIIFNQPGALPEASMRSLIEQALKFEVPPQTEETEEAEEPQQ